MFKFIFSLLIVGVFVVPGFGQDSKLLPSSVSGGFEIGNYFYSRIVENVDFRELTADIQFGRIFFTGDYGFASFAQNETFHTYSNEGSYYRLGMDINFIKKKKQFNAIFLGARYAQARFDETVEYSTNNGIETNPVWPPSTFSEFHNDVKGRWFELVGGLKVDVFKGFQLGFTGRYKLLPSADTQSSFANYYIPGYGKRVGNTNWGISYYVGYRFKFKK